MSYKQNFELLFFRPLEPIFTRKGYKGESFDIPTHFFNDRYKEICEKLILEYISSGSKISIKNIKLPNISFALQIDRNEMFSTHIPLHRNIATELIKLLTNCVDLEELQATAIYIRDRISPHLFNYVLSVTCLQRSDIEFRVPTHVEVFPDKFIHSDVFQQVHEEISIIPEGSRIPVAVPIHYSSVKRNREEKLAYFREDVALNLAYWNWHIKQHSYTINDDITKRSTKGEAFYYFHQQIITRYNCERLCNGLQRVQALNNLREPIEDGYFPNIEFQLGGHVYAPRFNEARIKDLQRKKEQIYCQITVLERYIERIMNAIDVGKFLTVDGKKININNEEGINYLANLIYSPSSSLNKDYYGDICNMGHLLLAFCHDSDSKYLENFSVMADDATALRDPIFYKWHLFLCDIFKSHKDKLSPYTKYNLHCPELQLLELELEHDDRKKIKEIKTFWGQSDLNISKGLNFTSKGDVYINLVHLHYAAFNIRLKIKNITSADVLTTVRIFLAPCKDEDGNLMKFSEQRQFMMELDKFTITARSGINNTLRRSDESSLTRNLIKSLPKKSKTDPKIKFDFGWPSHLLIPKGDEDGMEFVFFAMVSTCNDTNMNRIKSCSKISSYYDIGSECTDSRPMGFPFDRNVPSKIETLSDFILPNMKTTIITIKHENKINLE